MKVLVTGGAGYIGSVLTRQLLKEGHQVRVVDILNFGGESILGIFNDPNFQFVKGDIRNKSVVTAALEDMEAVVHLAAIVGDPACAQQPAVAQETNLDASIMLFEMAQKLPQLKRFIFASTCSNYGKMKDQEYVTETSELRPVSLYAKLKVSFEKYLLESATSDSFVPTALRFATVYGLSPRMRFDLTLNEFTRDATLGKKIEIYGEQFWRPYCHVTDLARACILVLESRANQVDHRVFGVGDTDENYQKKMLAEEILKIIPKAQFSFVHRDEDPRDYKVDFSRIRDQLGFKITKQVPEGIREIHAVIRDGILTNPENGIYSNSV